MLSDGGFIRRHFSDSSSNATAADFRKSQVLALGCSLLINKIRGGLRPVSGFWIARWGVPGKGARRPRLAERRWPGVRRRCAALHGSWLRRPRFLRDRERADRQEQAGEACG